MTSKVKTTAVNLFRTDKNTDGKSVVLSLKSSMFIRKLKYLLSAFNQNRFRSFCYIFICRMCKVSEIHTKTPLHIVELSRMPCIRYIGVNVLFNQV